jgi:hypothetical protein
MSEIQPGATDFWNRTMPTRYHIRVKGHLDLSWSEWLGDLVMTHESDGVTVLSGPVADQAALLGLLLRLHDLGLTLLSVTSIIDRKGGS